MLWTAVMWISFMLVIAWFFVFVGGLLNSFVGIFKRESPSSVDQSMALMFDDEPEPEPMKHPTAPPDYEYASTRNAKQHLRRIK
jgi:hypothetical protein